MACWPMRWATRGEPSQFEMARGDSEGEQEGGEDSLDGISLPGAPVAEAANGIGGGAARGGRPADSQDAKRRALAGGEGPTARWARHRSGGESSWRRLDWADEHESEHTQHGNSASSGAAGDAAPQPRAAGTEAAAQLAEAAAREAAEQQRKIQEAEQRRAAEAAAQRQLLEQSYSPEQREQAELLHAQQAAAASAGFGSEGALEIARQAHALRVQEVVKAAREKDIPVNQAEFLDGSPEELEDWARRHI